jgi:uncharacterized repeat protein (TIGR01451 family)
MGLLVFAGCQHNLASKSKLKVSETPTHAIAPMHHASSGQPVVPVSRMHTGVSDSSDSAHSHTGCGGACCQSHAYRPAFPELSQPGCSNGQCQLASCQSAVPCEQPYRPRHVDPQEYVYDGGDRDPQARLRDDLSVVGLDSEDTVIRFETESGTVELQSGCRVPIYAPRFASTRKITPLGFSDHVVATHAALREQSVGRMADVLPPTKVQLRQGPMREESVNVVEAFRDRNRGVLVDKVLPAIEMSEAFKPFEDLSIIRSGKQSTVDQVQLRRSTMAALSWTNVEELVVLVDTVEAKLVEVDSQPEELLMYELDGKPRVRLCKVASHQVAEPGDTIDFTIRFDNVGDQMINNIVVHDSLTPRLEYVEDSQKTSVKSNFSSAANDVGSSVLTWTFTEPIRPGQGGYIRFQCKVR